MLLPDVLLITLGVPALTILFHKLIIWFVERDHR
jgi:hypothetical protein